MTTATATQKKHKEASKEVSPKDKFVRTRAEMQASLVERDEEIDLCLVGLLSQQHALLVGVPGCLRGDVPIYDPLDGTTKSVKERYKEGKNFHVYSANHETGKFVIAEAEKPWKYPVSPMIEFSLRSGESFAVTYGHRFFDGQKYVCASEVLSRLREFGVFLLPTIQDNNLSGSVEGAPHSSQKAASFQDDHRLGHHSCGVQPHRGVVLDQSFSPSLSDSFGSPSYDLLSKGLGGRKQTPFRPFSQSLSLLSRMGFYPPSGSRIEDKSGFRIGDKLSELLSSLSRRTRLCGSYFGAPYISRRRERAYQESNTEASSLRPIISASEDDYHQGNGVLSSIHLRGVSSHSGERSLRGTHPTQTNPKPHRQEAISYESPSIPFRDSSRNTNMEGIVLQEVISAREVNAENYYDFRVPIYENYVACGVIHHNTAKSFMAEIFRGWIDGAKSLTIHCCKDTTRNAAFGPVKLSALKEDRTERNLSGGAADCEVVVLEEVFKAGPAVLDMFLMLMNERTYREGLVKAKAPLRFLLGTSNEWSPDGCETALAAFFDRFLLRKAVKPIRTQDGVRRLVKIPTKENGFDRSHTPKLSTQITLSELDQAHKEVLKIAFTEDAEGKFLEIHKLLGAEGIVPGDRRLKMSVVCCQAYAYLSGSDEVQTEHLEVLKDVLWIDPVEQPMKAAKVIAKIANPVGMQINDLLVQAEDVLAKEQPVVAAPKLKEIVASIKKLPAHPRKEKAIEYVQRNLRATYNKAIGIQDDEEVG